MNMKYLELREVITECRDELVNSLVTQVTQYNTRSFIIHFNNSSVNYKLLVSLQTPFVRAHLTSHEGTHAVIPFISQLNKEITSYAVSQLELIQGDRILKVTLTKGDTMLSLVAELFSKSPNCYLINEKGTIIHSLFKSPETIYTPPKEQNLPPPAPLGSPVSSKTIEEHYDAQEAKASFEREKTQIRKILYRRLKKSKRSIEELSKKLEACLNWEQTHHLAELLQANLYQVKKGMDAVEVDDWLTGKKASIPLDPALPPHKQVDSLFQQGKKLKKGIDHLPRQLEEREAERSRLEEHLEILSQIEISTDLEKFCKQHGLIPPQPVANKKKEAKPRLPYRRYTSSKGMEILVGKKDKDNDVLTFHHANGSDWWLHVSELPGSHVIIKTNKGADPDQQTLYEACQLAIAHSKAKGEGGAEVVITQQKFLKRKKGGRPGTVYLSKHQKKWIDFDPGIINSLST